MLQLFPSYYTTFCTYASYLASHPLEFGLVEGCASHSQCTGAWKLSWIAAIRDKPCPLAEVDRLKTADVARTLLSR